VVILNALAKGLQNFIAGVGCSGGRGGEWEGDNFVVDDSEKRN
jgi:hypothetical protein